MVAVQRILDYIFVIAHYQHFNGHELSTAVCYEHVRSYTSLLSIRLLTVQRET